MSIAIITFGVNYNSYNDFGLQCLKRNKRVLCVLNVGSEGTYNNWQRVEIRESGYRAVELCI